MNAVRKSASDLVSVRALWVRRGDLTVLRQIDLSIAPGQIVTIVGPNGSGKSTLLRTIVGAVLPSAGVVRKQPGLRIGYVPQRIHIDRALPMTVLRFLNLPNRVSADASQSALAAVGAEALAGRQLSALSGGQVQRVLMARALLNDPGLLVLDEPAQGLDPAGCASLYHLLEETRRTLGCAIVMASHELHVVMAASDWVICLNGHICCEGPPAHVVKTQHYRSLLGVDGTLAIYNHRHDHAHDDDLHGSGSGVKGEG